MTIQSSQLKQIFSILPEELKKDKDMREIFISDFTDGRTKSTKELTRNEANDLIAALKGEFSNYGIFDKNNLQHRAILNICYDLNWTVFNNRLKRNVADLQKLGSFIAGKKSPVRKPLSKMSVKECSKLISALEGILKSQYKK